jgi:1,2-diacylglycerol 3-beta-galactosyltransferase
MPALRAKSVTATPRSGSPVEKGPPKASDEAAAPERRRILILYAKSGGGHRSAAQAVAEALDLSYSDWIDPAWWIFHLCTGRHPPPATPVPGNDPQAPGLGLAYRLTDGQRRTRLIQSITWPYVRDNTRYLLAEHPGDLIVSFHPLITAPALRP